MTSRMGLYKFIDGGEVPMCIPYGSPVFITSGKFKGRIGYFDDDGTNDRNQPVGYVSLGPPLYSDEYEIPMKSLREVTTEDLLKRQDEIETILIKSKYLNKKTAKNELLTESIESLLSDRYFRVRFLNKGIGKKLFIAHSSKDKFFARLLATDLAEEAHIPWLDEWNIKVGDSIPNSISDALEKSDYVLVVLSNNSIGSQWVQQEWHTKYLDEISEGKIKVIPLLVEDCKIPELLKTKKYADFREDYRIGFTELLIALN